MRTGPDPEDLAWLIQLHLARYSGRLARARRLMERGLPPVGYRVEELERLLSIWVEIGLKEKWSALSVEEKREVVEAAEDEGMATNGWTVR
jgi:hypothetical protein